MSTSMAEPTLPNKPRRFASLDPEKKAQHDGLTQKLEGIVFDVDGTLCLPQSYMFHEMRQALNIPPKHDILEFICNLPTVSERTTALQKIRQIELNALTTQTPQPGLQSLMDYLERRNVNKALCTRNFPRPVQHLLNTSLPGRQFYPIVTRETSGVPPKPRPEGLWEIVKAWRGETSLLSPAHGAPIASGGNEEGGIEQQKSHEDSMNVEGPWEDVPSPSQSPRLVDDQIVVEELQKTLGKGMIMVGDTSDDIIAGHRAGAATVLLANDENGEAAKMREVDLVITELKELIDVLEGGFLGR
ncbi:MAG: hypothetical protein Q9160_001839 [Pyrenula sp. 1 TL-2023]